jgi:hypothetical protein
MYVLHTYIHYTQLYVLTYHGKSIQCKFYVSFFFFINPIYFMIEMCINTLMLVFPRIGKENRTLTVISNPEFGIFFLQKLEIMGGRGYREGRSVFRKLIILFDLAAVYLIGLKSHRSNCKNFIYLFLCKSQTNVPVSTRGSNRKHELKLKITLGQESKQWQGRYSKGKVQ